MEVDENLLLLTFDRNTQICTITGLIVPLILRFITVPPCPPRQLIIIAEKLIQLWDVQEASKVVENMQKIVNVGHIKNTSFR